MNGVTWYYLSQPKASRGCRDTKDYDLHVLPEIAISQWVSRRQWWLPPLACLAQASPPLE
jgi:hypothetical protein